MPMIYVGLYYITTLAMVIGASRCVIRIMNLCPIAKLRQIPRLYLLKRLRVGNKGASFVLNSYVLRRLPRFLTLLDEETSVTNSSVFHDKIYISINFTLKLFTLKRAEI